MNDVYSEVMRQANKQGEEKIYKEDKTQSLEETQKWKT